MTAEVYITDKSGKKMFIEIVSGDYSDSAIRNAKRILEMAKLNPKEYHFLDLDTADIRITMHRNK